MKFLTKEKSRQKRKGVNNQNNSPFHYELFPVINTKLHHHHKSKKSIKNNLNVVLQKGSTLFNRT